MLGAKPTEQKIGSGGLFGNNANTNNATGGGLFGALPEGWLKSGPAAPKEDDNEEDDEGDSEPLEDKSEGNPEESKYNYEYQIDFEKIVNVRIN